MGFLKIVGRGSFLFLSLGLSLNGVFAQNTTIPITNQVIEQPQAAANSGLLNLRREFSNELSRLQAEKANVQNSSTLGVNAQKSLDNRIFQVEKQLDRINQLFDKETAEIGNQSSDQLAADNRAELVITRTQITQSQQRIAELEQLLKQKNQPVASKTGLSFWEILGIASAILFGGLTLLNKNARNRKEYVDEAFSAETYKDAHPPESAPSTLKQTPAATKTANSGTANTTPHKPAETGSANTQAHPITRAAACLANNKKPQAIEILEDALEVQSDPGGMIATRLLYLYRSIGNIDAFTKLFASSEASIQQGSDWAKVQLMAENYISQYQAQTAPAVLPEHQPQNPPVDKPGENLVTTNPAPAQHNNEAMGAPAAPAAPAEKQVSQVSQVSKDLQVQKVETEEADDFSESVITMIDESIKDTGSTGSSDLLSTTLDSSDASDLSTEEVLSNEAPEDSYSDSILMMIDEAAKDAQAKNADTASSSDENQQGNTTDPTAKPAADDLGDFSDSILMMIDESLDGDVTNDPAALLSQAKEYLEFGEKSIAQDFLNEVVKSDSGDHKAHALQLLAMLNNDNTDLRT